MTCDMKFEVDMNERDSHATDASSPTLVFTLVHGTFSADADWVKSDSKFCKALTGHLAKYSVKFDPFPWGNETWRYRDNFDSVRRCATKRLEVHISELRKYSRPGDRLFLVAHSHGGNIALAAMKNPIVRRSLYGVVFLATPFLFRRRRQLPALVVIRWSVLFLLFAIWFFRGQLPLAVSIGAFTALYAFVLRRVLFPRAPKTDDGEDERLPDQLVARGAIDDENELSFPKGELPPILILRPSADEASGLLRTSQFITWLLGIVLGGVAQVISVLVSAAIVTNWLSANVAWTPDWVASLNVDLPIGIALGLVCVLAVLLVTQQHLFAFDAGDKFGDIEIIAEDAPPGVTAQIQVLRPRSPLTPESIRQASTRLNDEQTGGLSRRLWSIFPKLAHTGIYDRRETPEEIAAWVSTIVSRPRVSTVSDEMSQV